VTRNRIPLAVTIMDALRTLDLLEEHSPTNPDAFTKVRRALRGAEREAAQNLARALRAEALLSERDVPPPPRPEPVHDRVEAHADVLPSPELASVVGSCPVARTALGGETGPVASVTLHELVGPGGGLPIVLTRESAALPCPAFGRSCIVYTTPEGARRSVPVVESADLVRAQLDDLNKPPP
jgi:hypothetical protein